MKYQVGDKVVIAKNIGLPSIEGSEGVITKVSSGAFAYVVDIGDYSSLCFRERELRMLKPVTTIDELLKLNK